MDLDAAVAMAQAIHSHVGNNECDDDQLAAWTDQSAKGSSFHDQCYASRSFGILAGDSNKHRLTETGQTIVDPTRLREGKARAFLTVPLYKAIFRKYERGALPTAVGLERAIVAFGVSEKQKERARQVFERSAEQAGFFEHGKNRLVMPGAHLRTDDKEKLGDSSGTNGESGGCASDPLVLAIIEKLPLNRTWPDEDRVNWLKTLVMAFQMAYDADEEIEVKKKEAAD
jgi:hypothetical protein